MKQSLLLFTFSLLFTCFASAQFTFERLEGPAGSLNNMKIHSDLHGHYFASFIFSSNKWVYSDDGIQWKEICTSCDRGMYVGCDGWLYGMKDRQLSRSADQGRTWNLMQTSPLFQLWNTLVADTSGNLWLWEKDKNQLYQSLDQGASWTLRFSRYIHDSTWGFITLKINPYTNDVWMIRQKNETTFHVWTKAAQGPGIAQVLVFEKGRSSKPGLYFGPDGAVYVNDGEDAPPAYPNKVRRTLDSGLHWDVLKVNGAPDFHFKNFAVTAAGRIYGGSYGTTLFSDDKGQTWNQMSPPWQNYFNEIYAFSDGSIFGLGTNLFRSEDNGEKWNFSGYNLGEDFNIGSPAFMNSQEFYVHAGGFVYKTKDKGKTFQALKFGTDNPLSVSRMFTNPKNNLLFVQSQDLLRSSDGGETFQSVFKGIYSPYDIRYCSIDSSGNLYVLKGKTFYFSSNNGDSWVATGTHSCESSTKVVTPAGDIFLLDFQRVRRSHDRGQTFAELGHGYYFQSILSDRKGRLWANNFNMGLMTSSDGGTTWHPDTHAPQNSFLLSVCQLPSGMTFFTTFNDKPGSHADSTQLFQSCGEGCSWQKLEYRKKAVTGYYEARLQYGSDGHLYITDNKGIHQSNQKISSIEILRGQVFRDNDLDCVPSKEDQPFSNTMVRISNDFHSTYIRTDTAGYFCAIKYPGAYTAEHWPPSDSWATCTKTISDSFKMFVRPKNRTLKMEISATVPWLRLCFDNTYVVRCCNTGNLKAERFVLRVVPGEFLEFVSSTIPTTAKAGDTLLFSLGDIDIEQCVEMRITFKVSCAATMGQWHCTSFWGTADHLNSNSESRLWVEGSCQGDQAGFLLHNHGAPMQSAKPFIIFDDDLNTIKSGSYQLKSKESQMFIVPFSGKTIVFRGERQENASAGRYFGASVEGCSLTVGERSNGYIFSDDQESWSAIDCQQNRSSFDPNEKHGFPNGWTEQHYIETSQNLSYLILFQNTGTDTAFNVVIEDQLSTLLDPATFHLDNSSHPCKPFVDEHGLIRFKFANILLPDSNINEAASHGFVRFSVKQKKGNPEGSVILNSADIFFDFNAPIRTNETMHTVGIPLKKEKPQASAPATPILVQPNPFSDNIHFTLPKEWTEATQLTLLLTDCLGRSVDRIEFAGAELDYPAATLAPSAYIYRIIASDGALIGDGILVKQ